MAESISLTFQETLEYMVDAQRRTSQAHLKWENALQSDKAAEDIGHLAVEYESAIDYRKSTDHYCQTHYPKEYRRLIAEGSRNGPQTCFLPTCTPIHLCRHPECVRVDIIHKGFCTLHGILAIAERFNPSLNKDTG